MNQTRLQSFALFRVSIGILSTAIEGWAVWLIFKQAISPMDAFILLLASSTLIMNSLDHATQPMRDLGHNQVTI